MEEQKFYPLKGKMNAVGVFASMLMIIVGCYGVFIKVKINSALFIYYLIILVTGIIFLVINLISYLNKNSGLYLNPKALIIKSDFWVHKIEWKNIKAFRTFEMMKRHCIAIELFDEDKFLASKNGYLKQLGKLAKKRHGTPITIAASFYNVSRFELLSELNYYLQKYR